MNYKLKTGIYGLLVAAITLSAACKKTEETTPEPTVTINIQSPTEGANVAQGETLQITATVTSDVELHGYEWKLTDKNADTLIAEGGSHSHAKEMSISGSYVNQLGATTNAELEISVEVDHDGTEASKKVNIILNQ